MYEKRYSMTREENVFWAKRNQVDYIWKSANLEGIAVTFPETQTICEGISVQGKSIDDINSIVQLKHGWQMLFETLDEKTDLSYVKKLHMLIGKMTVINAGSLRVDEVRIAGSTYIPPIPEEKETDQAIRNIVESGLGWTEKALNLAIYLMKAQLFYDGNKRIAMMMANKELIANGCGVLTVSQEYLETFFQLLVNYYERETEKEKLKQFLYSCIDGYKKNGAKDMEDQRFAAIYSDYYDYKLNTNV